MMPEAKFRFDLGQIKDHFDNHGLWVQWFQQYNATLSAAQKLGSVSYCPKHGGQNGDAFNFFKDASSINRKSKAIAICNTCGVFTPIELTLVLEGKTAIDYELVERMASFAGIATNNKSYQEHPPSQSGLAKKKAVTATSNNPSKYFSYFISKAQTSTSDVVAQYLHNRGLSEVVGRFEGDLLSHTGDTFQHMGAKLAGGAVPAMVAMIRNIEGEVLGCQRIYLTSDGHKLRPFFNAENKLLTIADKTYDRQYTSIDCKKLLKKVDSLSGGAVHFGEPTDLLCIAEGIETSLAVAIGTEEATWSGVQTSMMGSMQIPDSVKKVLIFADKDLNEAGKNAAEKLAERLTMQGKTVFIFYPPVEIPEGAKGVDWLDVLVDQGKEAIVRAIDSDLTPYQSARVVTQVVDVAPPSAPDSGLAKEEGGEDRPHCFRKNPPPLLVPNQKLLTCEAMIQILNRRFVHVVHGGKNYVIRTGKDQLDRFTPEFFKLDDFKAMFSHWPKTIVGTNENGSLKLKNTGAAWLEHPDANMCYDGITFYPQDVDYHNGRLNTYYGFGVQPIICTEADIQDWLNHVYQIICDGDAGIYNYLLDWCAHMIQKPQEKPGVAVILKAGQGTGKGTFAEPLGQIMGSHYLYADSPAILSGRFNGALENKIFVFADEAFFGSKAATDKMKAKITESFCTIERKGIDIIMVRDFARVLMASNKENLVRIETDERRYLILEETEEKKQDLSYCKLSKDQSNCGYLAPRLLYILLNRDISSFMPQDVPKTKALLEQKIDNLEPVDRYIYHMLLGGCVVKNSGWPQRMPTSAVLENFDKWLEAKCLSVFGDAGSKLGKRLAKIGITKSRIRLEGERAYVYEFGTLDSAREKFAELLKGDLDW